MRTLAALSLVVFALTLPLAAQGIARQGSGQAALNELFRTEQRFAARALAVGWKAAFLEYFADDAVGFDGERSAKAKDLFRLEPDPPKELQLVWEPRYGDVSAA